MNSIGHAGWLYVAACLAVPALWGVCCAWIFGKLDARTLAKASDQPAGPTTRTSGK